MQPTSFTFLVVDDEALSRTYIRALIAEFCTGAEILEAGSAKAAISLLEERDVDVLFLDVKMPGADGFHVLDNITHRHFEIIFVTAYSQYALPAIKQQAFDYLLKPIRKSEFKETLIRVMEKCSSKKTISPSVNEQDNYLKGKISISHLAGVKLITLEDIICLKASNTYTIIHLKSGEKFTASRPINRFEALLHAPWFFRIHKSYIINMAELKDYVSQDGQFALMNNGEQLNISRYRISDFLNALRTIADKRNI